MSTEAWEMAADHSLWPTFEQRFQFRLDWQRGTEPAILEPAGSVTVDLAPIFSARYQDEFDAGEDRVNDVVFAAFRRVFGPATRLIALDWQHSSYWCWPHRLDKVAEGWGLLPFPNANYYIFMTESMSHGTFGHPWEQTLCVFGTELVDDLVPQLSQFLPIRRRQPAA